MASARPPERSSALLLWSDGRSQTVHLRTIGKSGGAGEVYAIEDHPGWVAKVYHASARPEQLAHYARKIDWMIRHPPTLPALPPQYEGVVQLAWPQAVVQQGRRFAGFAMRKIDFERTLELDYLLTRRQAAQEGFAVDYGKLLTVCYNLAALIDCLHAGRIAIVDLKPINLKVYKDELFVSILDCDGFHIQAEDFVSDAPQVTPEYLAPELHDRPIARPQSQDAFALATIAFRLLNYGIHPYAGIAGGRRDYPSELAGRIRQGLYPYGQSALAGVRPAPASVHECFPPPLRALFDRAFTAAAGARPSAREWLAVLGVYAGRDSPAMGRCGQGHLQFAGLPCPTCRRAQLLRGHVVRQRRILTRIQATPGRAVSYLRKTLQGTHSSPFQAALAQAQLQTVQMAPVTLPLRQVLAIELVWALGLLITLWWAR